MAHYGPERYWLPSGAVLANRPVRVFPRFSNVLASLYSDAGLSVPLLNPTSTDASGFLEFYAAPGDYWIFVNNMSFQETLVDDDEDTWHATVVHEQTVPANPWVIVHDLNTEPDVNVVDLSGIAAGFVQVNYVDLNTVELDFGGLYAGFAYLRR